MDASAASWLVIVLALTLANLPFMNEKLFGFIPLGSTGQGGARRKHFALRLAELIVLYFVVGALGHALESRIGNAFPQNWEFYAITACLFIVLAFPGFVVRYLMRRH